jgi:hypothetical protein
MIFVTSKRISLQILAFNNKDNVVLAVCVGEEGFLVRSREIIPELIRLVFGFLPKKAKFSWAH